MSSKILSSTFSINMLNDDCCTIFRTLSKEEFLEEVKNITNNVVNPRHTSTAALVAKVTDLPCAGGFASVKAGDRVLVIMPSRELMSRSGAEIKLSDLDSCQFKLVTIINLRANIIEAQNEVRYMNNGAGSWKLEALLKLLE